MNSKILFIIFFNILLLFSCKEEPKLDFKDSDFTTKNNKLVEVIIPIATGNTDVVTSINSTVSNNVIEMLQIGDSSSITAKTIEESIDVFNEEYNSFNADFPETTQPWEAQIDGEVMYESPEIISISLTAYLYTGGAHGNLTISFLNFDAETGELIKPSSLFKNMQDFNKVAKPYFENTVEDKDVFIDAESFTLPENIGFNDEGVILLYNQYEIASYSTGIIEFTIPIEEVNSLLNFNSTQ